MDPARAAENPAVASGGGGSEIHHEVVDVLHARDLAWRLRLGYSFVAAPVMAVCAGLLDGPWAAGLAYAVLLLGVASVCRAMLPPRLLERARQPQEGRPVGNDGHSNRHHEATSSEAAMAWCGYALVASPVMGSFYGLADTPGAAFFAYALLLLGFALISIAMLPLRPMESFLQEESRAVGNGNCRGDDEVVVPRARGMDWTGYFVVVAPVLGSWAGLVEGPAATFFAYALLLLGVAFIIIAMRALAKPKMA